MASSSASGDGHNHNDGHDSSNLPFSSSGQLSAPKMMSSSPQHHGYVMRLRVPTLYRFLPKFIRKLVSSIRFLSFLAPQWERRYLIVLGGYLYKFRDDASAEPKGTPTPLEAIEARLRPDDDASAGGNFLFDDETLPAGCKGGFVVATSRKTYRYATSNREDALTWVNALRESRQEAITRNMGHAPKGSYPAAWKTFDLLARKFVGSKDRIRSRMEQHNLRELEMASLSSGGAGPVIHHGYYS